MKCCSILAVFAAAGLVAALPTAPTTDSSAPAATCSPGAVVAYTVVSGDTLTKISQAKNSGICNIAKANGLGNPNLVSAGQVLQVPTAPCELDNTCLAKPSENDSCVQGGKATCAIVSGDTFFVVAQRLNLSVDALAGANPGVDPLLLQIGQVINIPVCK
jgi:LysM repeat protein